MGENREGKAKRGGIDSAERDGGWGWVVCLAAYFVYFLNGGTFYSNGLLLPEFLEAFDASKVATTWLASVQNGFCQCSAVFGGVLVELYGCRVVCMSGTLIIVAGLVTSVFVTDIRLMYITYSIIPGIGMGIQFMPAVVIVQHYFTKRRSLATGIVTCGSPSGCFVYAIFTRYLLDSYGWRGTLLLMGGMVFHAVAVAYIIQEPEDSHIAPPLPPEDQEPEHDQLPMHNGNVTEPIAIPTPNKLNGSISNGQVKSFEVHSLPNGHTEHKHGILIASSLPHYKGYMDSPSLPKISETTNGMDTINGLLTSPVHKRLTQVDRMDTDSIHSCEAGGSVHFSDEITVNLDNTILDNGKVEHNGYNGIHGNLLNEDTGNNHENNQNDNREIPLPEDDMGDDDHGIPQLSWSCKLCKECATIFHSFVEGFKELKDAVCLLMFLGALFVCMGYQVPYLFLPIKCLQLGYSPWAAAVIISVIGASDAVGRIVFGWLGSFRRPGKMFLFTVGTLTCGIACLLFGISDNYSFFIVLAVIYGSSIGCFVSLTAPVLVDLLGLERIARLFGLINLGYGVGFLLSPPFEAYLYAVTNDVNVPFYFGSAMQMLAVATYLITIYVNRYNKAKFRQEIDDHEIKHPSHLFNEKRSMNGSISHLGSIKGSISYLGSVTYIGSMQGSVSHLGGSVRGSVSHLGGSVRGSVSHLGGSVRGSVSHLGGSVRGSVSHLGDSVHGSFGHIGGVKGYYNHPDNMHSSVQGSSPHLGSFKGTIMLATPAFGSMVSINTVNSLGLSHR